MRETMKLDDVDDDDDDGGGDDGLALLDGRVRLNPETASSVWGSCFVNAASLRTRGKRR